MQTRDVVANLPLVLAWGSLACTPLPSQLAAGGSTGVDMGPGTAAVSTGTGPATATTSGETSSPTSMTSGGSTGADDDPTAQTGTSSDTGSTSAGPVPDLLSQTGLYADILTDTIAPEANPYTPRFELWADTATKRRWLSIPPGTQIDTSDMDEWVFPTGTKIWKEFSRDGVRIETRMLQKVPPGMTSLRADDWVLVAYVWNEAQTEAIATYDGLPDANGTAHDVPDEDTCFTCHQMRAEKPIGVSAVQLAHDGEGLTLTSMAARGLISTAPAAPIVVPGDETTQAVLGYFHANCGHCHRAGTPDSVRLGSIVMWLETDQMATVEETPAYVSLVNRPTESLDDSDPTNLRITGGDPATSEVIRRIAVRDLDGIQMPPVGTEDVDEDARASIAAWIETLPAPAP